MSDVLRAIPPAAYPLGLGLLTTSSMFFGNVGLSLTGPLPIIRGQIGAAAALLSPAQKLAVWSAFFDEATKYIVGGTLLSAALHLSAVALLPTRPLQALAATSAAISLTVLPYTGVFVLPTINALKALEKKAAPELSPAEGEEATRLIAQWDARHKVRFAFYAPAWAAGLAALVGVLAL